jgi:hypothetical protein
MFGQGYIIKRILRKIVFRWIDKHVSDPQERIRKKKAAKDEIRRVVLMISIASFDLASFLDALHDHGIDIVDDLTRDMIDHNVW